MCIQFIKDLDSLLFGLYWLDGKLLVMLPLGHLVISFPGKPENREEELPRG